MTDYFTPHCTCMAWGGGGGGGGGGVMNVTYDFHDFSLL